MNGTLVVEDHATETARGSKRIEPGRRRALPAHRRAGRLRPPKPAEGVEAVLGLSARSLYDALLTRDRRFDGRMFVGVSSTRIYCRPICTVRPPRFENCSFYRTAAAAEQAGFRPCLRCRPELAPGSSAPVDAVSRLAALAIRRIEDGALSALGIEGLAAEFGVTARHLRRAIRREAGLTPVALAQTQRLLLAKQLLTDTRMTVTEAAFAAGFSSLRRFNAAFETRYRLTPSSLRRSSLRPSSAAAETGDADAYRFDLAVRPPFDLAALLAFWQPRATPGVEQVADGWYRRSVRIGDRAGWVAIGPARKNHTVQVCISPGLGRSLGSVLCRLKAMLDVRADPERVAQRLANDPLLAPLLEARAGATPAGDVRWIRVRRPDDSRAADLPCAGRRRWRAGSRAVLEPTARPLSRR